MYHIANDIRAKKSTDLIIQGLEECLQEKTARYLPPQLIEDGGESHFIT